MIDRRMRNAVDRLVRDGWNTNVNFGAVDLIVLVGFLQLAMKHPTLTPVQVSDCRQFVERLSVAIRDREPAIGELIRAGDSMNSLVTVKAIGES